MIKPGHSIFSVCRRRPEKNAECLPLSLSTSLFETRYLPKPEAHYLQPGSSWVGSICLYNQWGHKHMKPCLTFYISARNLNTKSSWFKSKHFYSLSHLPAPDSYHFYFMCLSVLPTCMPVVHHLSAYCLWRPEEGTDFQALGLQTVVSHRVDVGNQAWVLWKGSQCSYALSHLSIYHFYMMGINIAYLYSCFEMCHKLLSAIISCATEYQNYLVECIRVHSLVNVLSALHSSFCLSECPQWPLFK